MNSRLRSADELLKLFGWKYGGIFTPREVLLMDGESAMFCTFVRSRWSIATTDEVILQGLREAVALMEAFRGYCDVPKFAKLVLQGLREAMGEE